ncbi:MAG: GldG family protein [Treponema sp.]|nr:GldG family protein [Treponema sp.]
MMKGKGIKTIFESFHTRYIKYGGYAALVTFAVIIALILLNLIFQQISPQFDLTENRLFSLSEQSVQVIDSIDVPVTIYGLWQAGQENPQIKEVVDLYTSKNRNIRLEVLDPDKNPGLMTKYDKDNRGISPGSLIVDGPKGFKVLSLYDMYEINYANPQNPQITGNAVERRITGALLYVGSGETPAVYEITGHNEISLKDLQVQEMIERENYSLKQLNLIRGDIPDDASAIILNNPRSDFSPGEAEKLLQYLEGGGRLLVLMDYRSRQTPQLDELFGSFGFRFDYGVVMEPNQNYNTGSLYQVIPDAAPHDITDPITETETPMVFSFSRGITGLDIRRRTIELTPFLSSSRESYLRTDPENTSSYTVAGDLTGPLTLGMAVLDPQYSQDGKQTRIVAIGCGALLEPVNFYSQIPGNIDLFMNSLTWLEDRPETLSVRSKSVMIFPMRITGMQVLIFGIIFVVVIPLAFFAAGFIIWLKRRHL